MSILDVFAMALRNIWKRKLRTALSAFGVAVGSVAIIGIMSIGIGINKSIQDQMDAMRDATTIQIENWSGYRGNGKAVLDDAMIERIKGMKGVKAVTPYYSTSINVLSGRYGINWFSIVGIDTSVMEEFGFTLAEGTKLTGDNPYEILFGSEVGYDFNPINQRQNYIRWDLQSQSQQERIAKVNVLEDKIQMSFDWSLTQPPQTNQGSENPDEGGSDFEGGNQTAVKTFKPWTVKGVGILGDTGNSGYEAVHGGVMDIKVIVKMQEDYNTWQMKQQGRQDGEKTYGYQSGRVKVSNINDVNDIAKTLQDMGFDYVSNPTETVAALKGVLNTLVVMLMGVAAVSLIVAALGIINTMFMSVYERTREIGVMKVIGANLYDIKRLFLTEAGIMGLLGGSVGAILGVASSGAINSLGAKLISQMTNGMIQGDVSIIPPWLVGFVLLYSTVIGLVAGYLPARRATKMSALEAIKTE